MKIKKNHLRVIIICLFILQVLTCLSPPALSVGAQEEKAYFYRGVERQVLDNGLTIITLNRNDMPLVSINIFVNTGSINETEKTSGITHFCEHLFFRGTEKRTGTEIKWEIERLGGVFNAETSRDYTRYFVNVPSEFGLEALEIYCDSVRNANYTDESIEKERMVILEEYNLTRNSPATLLNDGIYNVAFTEHPYRKSVIGTVENIKRFNREDFLDYKNTFYTPENMVIVIVGNFDKTKYMSYIKKFFGDMPGGTPNRNISNITCPINNPNIVIDEKQFFSEKAYFVMGFKSPGFLDQQDVLAMDLLIFMLGQGKNSIMNRELKEKRKLVEDIGAHFLTSKEPGLVMFSTQIQASQAEQLKESIFTVLWNIKRGNFSDSDIERARNLLLKHFTYGNETNEGKAESLGFYEILGDMNFALNYKNLIRSVTKEDMVRTANKYFNDEYVLYILKPAAEKDSSR